MISSFFIVSPVFILICLNCSSPIALFFVKGSKEYNNLNFSSQSIEIFTCHFSLFCHNSTLETFPAQEALNCFKDLEGKKVGYPGIPTEELLLNTVVEYDGGNIQKVELINVGYDLVKALISKKVDAIIGAYWVHESFIIEKQGLKVNVLKIEDWGVPDFYELVIVTNENTVKNNPELIREFLDSTVKGYQYSIENPEAGINIMKNSNPEIDTE